MTLEGSNNYNKEIKMVETITAFFVALTIWEIGAFAIAVFLFGGSFFKESGTMFALGLGALLFYFFKIDLNLVSIGIFLGIGFAWMVFKFRGHAYETIERYKEWNISNKANDAKIYSEEEVKRRIFSEADKDVIFFWITAWPVSMVGFMLYDISKYVYDKIKVMLSNIVDNMMLKAGFAATVKVNTETK